MRHHPTLRVLAALVLSLLVGRHAARAQAEGQPGVDIVADGRLSVSTEAGQGLTPIAASRDWSRPQPSISRVVIMVHGLTREAAQYLEYTEQARETAGVLARTTLILAPQFLGQPDIRKFGLAGENLYWHRNEWPEGAPARGPAPLSPFDVLDTILARLADRAQFPALTHVVLAGHSSGGQLVQRYAAVGRGQATLAARGVALRHVVANPSSWLWFGDERPNPPEFGTCPAFNHWRYGLVGAPPYVRDGTGAEAQYLAQDMVYLIGDEDTDPDHRILDKTCAAMAQGPNRFARAMQFMFYLELRHPNQIHHRIVIAHRIGHEPARIFRSPCGLAALFERPGCAGLQ